MVAKKINYYLQSLKEIETFSKEGKKPTIALHACCGPCACYPIEFLSKYFSKITILFNNSNIYPQTEYERRLEELKKFISIYNEKYGSNVELIVFSYDNETYNKMLAEYGDVKEGTSRCFRCYEERMNFAYDYADKNGFDYFATVMTISRQKNSQKLNEIGLKLQAKYKTKYFFSDFKKANGQLRARELRIEYDLYNQQYCGCIYSYNAYLKKMEKENSEAEK